MPLTEKLTNQDFEGSTYVHREGRDISVDWKRIVKLIRKTHYFPKEVLEYLEAGGILSCDARGNYSLTAMSGVSILNPVVDGYFFYFKRKKDAEAYKKEMYKRARYSVCINKTPQ